VCKFKTKAKAEQSVVLLKILLEQLTKTHHIELAQTFTLSL
jgi:hypothetical protein